MGGTATTWLGVLAIALAGASCKEIEPETGAIRPTCKDADSNPAVSVSFARDLRPRMNNQVPGTRGCIGCHAASGGTMEGFLATGLDLSKLQLLRKGSSDDATILVPGKPCESRIVKKLQGVDPEGARMPRGGPYWSDAEIQLMIDWIAEGAEGADE